MSPLSNSNTINIKTLYHYTSAESFYNIIRSKSIWFTNYKYMNDLKEYEYGRERIYDVIKQFIQKKKVDEVLEKERVKIKTQVTDFLSEQVPQIIDKFSRLNQFYIFSLSQQRNKLSQWRGYGNSGVAIGFNFNLLNRDSNGHLLRCIYNHKMQENLIFDLLNHLINSIKIEEIEWANQNDPDSLLPHLLNLDYMHHFFVSILKFMITFKHESFFEEEEWRLTMHYIDEGDKDKGKFDIAFRPRNNMLIPYHEWSLKNYLQTDNTGKHIQDISELVTEIVVGPHNHQNLFKESVELFVKIYINNLNKTSSAKCKVTVSDIPYRTI